jgi:hypothetical protein
MLDRCMSAATEMMAAGAFLHQYEAYGLDTFEFRRALAQVEQVCLVISVYVSRNRAQCHYVSRPATGLQRLPRLVKIRA